MFQDLDSLIWNFYDLEDNAQEDLLKELNKRASANKADFAKYIDSLDYELESYRSIFYEAIWTSPKGFEDWLYDELVKLFEEAEQGNEGAIEDLSNVLYLCGIKTSDKDFYKKSGAFLLPKLNSPIDEIREQTSEAIMDLADMEGRNLSSEEIRAFKKMLTDSNFKIRIYTYSNLKELNLLSPGFELSFFDKVRARLTGMGGLL